MEQWAKAKGEVCASCGQETMRLIGDLCPSCAEASSNQRKAKVNRYRSGAKNPEQEVHVFTEGNGHFKVHIVDYEAGKVTTLENKEEGST